MQRALCYVFLAISLKGEGATTDSFLINQLAETCHLHVNLPGNFLIENNTTNIGIYLLPKDSGYHM